MQFNQINVLPKYDGFVLKRSVYGRGLYSLDGYVIRDIRVGIEGEQLPQFKLLTHWGNWPRLEGRGVICFCGQGECPGLLSKVWSFSMSMPDCTQSWNFRNFLLGGIEPPPYCPDPAVSDLHLLPAVKVYLSAEVKS